ncbi:MAG TPA: CHRD domain-containing protein [Ktedonobacteraceae bacterium]|jgi:hypothetical protein|nr:CHRD domain-containing protein [Ktedonobacteraceae bacterium]
MPQAHRKLYWLIASSVLVALLILTTYVVLNKMTVRAGGVVPTMTTVNLTHAPYGSASLKWDPGTEALTVTIELTGLAPNSTHPAHIHKGGCTSNGAVIYPLNNVVANASGRGTSSTTIAKVAQGIPMNGWSINVHNGPNLSPAEQFLPIACGNISNANPSLKGVQTLSVPLGATNAADQNVSGQALLNLSGRTLTVTINIHGLVPGSAHAAHIHAGSCQNQVPGNIVHMLNNVVANNSGSASSKTVINNVDTIPASGWYINVHRSTNLATQTGFDPIACGNVKG